MLLEGNVTILVALKDATQGGSGSVYKAIFVPDADPFATSGTGYGLAYGREGADRLVFQLADGAEVDSAQEVTSNSDSWEVVTARNTATAAILRRDGAQVATGTFSRTSGFVADEYVIGGDTAISTRHYTGDMGEIIVYNRALTDKEMLVVEAHLDAKYGL